ncbi:MAG TPA: 2TM domain-containing protein [Ideonella sp.]|nr:2TM domain-containing protein [Ideonella sp.]
MNTPAAHTDADHELLRTARRRVGMKIGFFIHAFVFTAVNLGLYAINSATGGPPWSRFPLWGWGLGLAIHGLVTFMALSGWRERMVASEAARLRERR